MSTSLNAPLATTLTSALHGHGVANLLDTSFADLLPMQEVRADAADFEAGLVRSGVRFEARAMPFDPRPLLIAASTYDSMTDRFQRLYPLLERVLDLYLSEAEVRRFFNLAPRHDDLVRIEVGYRPQIGVCRFDFTLSPSGIPQIYELNTQCPSSATTAVYFGELAAASRVQAHLDGLGLHRRELPLERQNSFATAMCAAAAAAGQPASGVGILNSRYVTLTNELDNIVKQFKAIGMPTAQGYVEDLTYRDGQLMLDGMPINLTYNKFDDTWGPDAFECAFSRTTAEVADYLRAYQDGALHAMNSFTAMYVTEHKSALAFLHSDLFAQHSTEAERALIEEIVPYTVVIRGADARTLEELATHRERFVLKKSLCTRGRNTVIGRSVTEQEWNQALAAAQAVGPSEDWVAQRLAPGLESTLNPINGTDQVRVFTNLACFLLSGQPVGLFIRTSVEETTNIGRIGFMQPPLVLAE